MLTIYHNPRCSKSRQTLALIEESNTPVTIVEYLKTPLSEEKIKQLLVLLKISPIEMMRTKESEFKEQNLANASDDDLIQAMVNTPKLIERPIVEAQAKAVILYQSRVEFRIFQKIKPGHQFFGKPTRSQDLDLGIDTCLISGQAGYDAFDVDDLFLTAFQRYHRAGRIHRNGCEIGVIATQQR